MKINCFHYLSFHSSDENYKAEKRKQYREHIRHKQDNDYAFADILHPLSCDDDIDEHCRLWWRADSHICIFLFVVLFVTCHLVDYFQKDNQIFPKPRIELPESDYCWMEWNGKAALQWDAFWSWLWISYNRHIW